MARSIVRNFFSAILTPVETLQVVQSVDEALSNIIEHGRNDNNEIQVDLKILERQVQVVITDHGVCFNPLEYPEVRPEQNYDSGIDGGIGIHIYRNFMQASYKPLQPRGNQLTLTRDIQP